MEEKNKCLKESQEKSQLKEINKTVQDLEMEIEILEKAKSDGILELKTLGK